jgi:hypothetical protein
MAHTLQQIIVITHDVNVDDIPTELRSIWSDVSLLNWPSEEKQREAVLDNLKTRVFLNFSYGPFSPFLPGQFHILQMIST